MFKQILTILFLLLIIAPPSKAKKNELIIFAGSVVKRPLEEITKNFEKKEDIKITINFGGSGFLLSQMTLSRIGDIYLPGSSDFMGKAKKLNVLFEETEKPVLYLVPAIVVQKGNPKGIKSLNDLAQDNVKVILANPKEVSVGLYSVEIIEKNLTEPVKKRLRNNIINYTESFEKTITAISLKTADATIGWSISKYLDPDMIDIIPLKKQEIKRIGYIPIAVTRYTKKKALAKKFVDYITSEEAKAVFKQYNYFTTKESAFNWIEEAKEVGGEYEIPSSWK